MIRKSISAILISLLSWLEIIEIRKQIFDRFWKVKICLFVLQEKTILRLMF